MNDDMAATAPVALWFPETTPPAGLRSLPALPVSGLVFFRPLAAAGEEEVHGDGFAGLNPVHDQDCQGLAGVVAGVAQWGEEFLAGQLAAMSNPRPRGGDGLASLVGRLRGPGGDDGESDRRRLSLNRARLLLALDELRRAQEEEIAAELARAEEKEAELLGELACVSGRAAVVPRPQAPAADRLRLVRAWFRIFFRSRKPLPRFLVCAVEDAAALADACGRPAVASFSLPGHAADWPEDIVEDFAALAADPAGFPESRRDALFLEMAATGGGGVAVSFHLLPWNGVMASLGLDESVDEKKGELGLIAALSLE